MSQFAVVIDGTDYTEYVDELKLTINGLNADGSGRDVQTGRMVRTKIADKWKVEIRLLRIWEDTMEGLKNSLQKTSYMATAGIASGEFYTDTIPLGSARQDKHSKRVYYDGVSFSLTEM